MPAAISSATSTSPPGNRQSWGALHGAAAALAIASAADKFSGLTVVLANSAESANTLQNELGFFSRDSIKSPVLQLPDWETLPYDIFSPHQDIISERLATLFRLPDLDHGILVVPVTTSLHRLAPTEFIAGNSFLYEVGQQLDLDALRRQLQRSGYRNVDTVQEHGEYAIRGALIDIFPMGSALPIRIDLFDDEIETLRSFDPETQCTLEKTLSIEILPAREFPHGDQGVKTFLDNWHLQFDVDPRNCQIYQDIKSGILPNGIEYYLPLFFDNCASLFDHLPAHTQIFAERGINQSAENFWHEVRDRHTEYGVDPERPLLAPQQLFIPVEEWFGALGEVCWGFSGAEGKACLGLQFGEFSKSNAERFDHYLDRLKREAKTEASAA